MCTSFCYGCLHINRYETHGVGIQWDNVWQSVHDDEMNFVYSVIMVAVDIVLYFILGWYISNVWPRKSFEKYIPLTNKRFFNIIYVNILKQIIRQEKNLGISQ